MNNSILYSSSEGPSHSATKKELRLLGVLSSSKKRPPKVVNKRKYVRRLFVTKPKSLLRAHNEIFGLSDIYDHKCNLSYFDQIYEPVVKLGEGSFGEVYKCRSKVDGQYYAVKKTKECYRGESDRKAKVEEVWKHELIPSHENIIGLYSAWEQDEHVYIQMELGFTSLEVYAEYNSTINESYLWNILLDMLLALKNLHDRNFVHLDVKLENIIVCDDGTCKLGDFGLLVDLKGDLNNAIEGDAKYLAPELMNGKFTKAADVFSLGISMLELASDLALPSNGKLWHELRDGVFPESVYERIPKELMNFIQRMMIRDFKKRPSIKTLLKHPRLKSMLKKRREAVEFGTEVEGRLIPVISPNPTIGTPPRCESPNSVANLLSVTPPTGLSTPNNSIFGTRLDTPDYEDKFDSRMDYEISSEELLNGMDISPKYKTPMPPCLRLSTSGVSLFSAKKLDFLNCADS